ncbi:MAG: FAD-binding oxidoreductase [Rickettsiales bacterium]|nr:FAD-binding oxidoreductase [Rickettsiales bacterium]
MAATKEQRLHGWGNVPVHDCPTWRPEKRRDLPAILRDAATLIARGQGRSYGDAALQPKGVVSTERLNHFMEFDTTQGIVRAQGGVTLAELMAVSIPKGWFPYTIPGTRHVSLGGALACNVHGKNHYKAGDFAEHVLSARVITASGEAVECSAQRNPDLFWATAGGMGMTGIIESVTLKLKPIRSASLSATTYRVESLEDMVAAFENYKDTSDYMVGWIDHMAKGEDIGRGIFEAANHIKLEDGGAALEKFTMPGPKLNIPFYVPSFVLNRYSMAIYNKLRFKKYSAWRQAETIDFNTFFHPLDSLGHWYKLYGKQGFFQYQALFPETHDVVHQMRTFLTAIQKKKLFSYLAVIKYHREGKGPMTFPVRGYSIALDFPNTRRVRGVLPQLDRWISDHGGRVYLAKDAMLTPDLFFTMYGEQATQWVEYLKTIDPEKKFTSLMSERLEWK